MQRTGTFLKSINKGVIENQLLGKVQSKTLFNIDSKTEKKLENQPQIENLKGRIESPIANKKQHFQDSGLRITVLNPHYPHNLYLTKTLFNIDSRRISRRNRKNHSSRKPKIEKKLTNQPQIDNLEANKKVKSRSQIRISQRKYLKDSDLR